MNIPEQIQRIVSPVFEREGVPDYIWQSIGAMETGGTFDPKAKNINPGVERSFGLFQLNTLGGQGQGLDEELLIDPSFNAAVAAPAIAQAYRAGRARGMEDGPELAAYVAANSGHPGYGLPLDHPAVTKVREYASQITNLGKTWREAANQAGPGFASVEGLYKALSGTVFSGNWWRRAGEIILLVLVGLAFLIVGVQAITRGQVVTIVKDALEGE